VLPLAAAAQAPNVAPLAESYLDSITEVDIRLKGAATATNAFPTLKLNTGAKFIPKANALVLTHHEPCWNKTTCPAVTAVTVQVFLNFPWGRSNVTRYTGLCGNLTECTLPAFSPLTAKAGEAYRFVYDRVNAKWQEPPSVVAVLPPVVVPPVVPPTTGTTATAPSGSLVTPQGTWTFGTATASGGNSLLLNGQHMAGGYGVEYRFTSGVLIVRSRSNGWWRWTGTDWASAPAP